MLLQDAEALPLVPESPFNTDQTDPLGSRAWKDLRKIRFNVHDWGSPSLREHPRLEHCIGSSVDMQETSLPLEASFGLTLHLNGTHP